MDSHSPQHPRVSPDKIGPDDPRYAYLVRRGYNKRFAGRPDYVRLVGSTEQVVDAVQEAVRVVIDTSLMTGVYFDQEIADGMRQRVNPCAPSDPTQSSIRPRAIKLVTIGDQVP